MTDLVAKFALRSDLHQSPMHAALLRHIGWSVAGESGSHIYYRTLGPLTIAKLQRPQSIDLDWLKDFRKKHHALTTYIEPGLVTPPPNSKLGFSVEPFAHSCTSLIDIKGSEQSILNSFSQKTRYNITRTLRKNNLKIITTSLSTMSHEQLTAFYALHDAWARKRSVVGYPISLLNAVIKAHGKTGDLHFCYRGDELVGSLLIIYYEGVATYYAAFATDSGYHTFAPTLLTWTAIQQAKAEGCDIFDFGGIYDPRYPRMYKKWQGFTKFKSTFHPTVVSYPPTTLQLGW